MKAQPVRSEGRPIRERLAFLLIISGVLAFVFGLGFTMAYWDNIHRPESALLFAHALWRSLPLDIALLLVGASLKVAGCVLSVSRRNRLPR